MSLTYRQFLHEFSESPVKQADFGNYSLQRIKKGGDDNGFARVNSCLVLDSVGSLENL
jgi:hypothetical protein